MNRIAATVLIAFSGAALAQAPATVPVAPTTTATATAAAYNLEADVTRAMKLFVVPGIAIAVV